MKRLLLVGIDPGTTVGYAALDVTGTPVASRSAKELNLDAVVAELSALGTVLVVATDKAKVPSFVSLVATKLGARVFAPSEDLRVVEKRELTRAQAYQGHHEMDALAAALIAFKNHERLFFRIDRFLADQKRPELALALKELVVKHSISIRAGFDFLTSPQTPITSILKTETAQRQLKREDYWKLYDTLTAAEREKRLLHRQNQRLSDLVQRLKRQATALKAAVKPETLIIRPRAELEQAKRTIKDLQQQLEHVLARQQRLQHVLLHRDAYVLAKRMRNLGFDEYKRVARVLGFQEGDILFLEDPNSFSQRTIKELQPIISLVIAVQPPKPKVAEQLPWVMLDAAAIAHTQDEYFAFFDSKALEKARGDKGLLRKLIQDYQQSRTRGLR
jgi:hypothetical protein